MFANYVTIQRRETANIKDILQVRNIKTMKNQQVVNKFQQISTI
jgi:hypothetical protein